MKRSEMVDKIVNFVYDATDCDVSLSKEEAALILDFIEKAGMQPPQSGGTLVQGMAFVKENNWEKE